MNLCFLLNKQILLVFVFYIYWQEYIICRENNKDICLDNCVKQRKYIFIISHCYFHVLSVDQVLLCLFYSHALIEYLVHGDCCCFFLVYMFFSSISTMLTAIPSPPKPTPKIYFLHRVNLLKLADRTKCSVKTSYFWKHLINFRNNYLTVQGHFWVFIERKIWEIKLTESIAFIRASRRICVVVCIVSIRVSHPIENLPPP